MYTDICLYIYFVITVCTINSFIICCHITAYNLSYMKLKIHFVIHVSVDFYDTVLQFMEPSLMLMTQIIILYIYIIFVCELVLLPRMSVINSFGEYRRFVLEYVEVMPLKLSHRNAITLEILTYAFRGIQYKQFQRNTVSVIFWKILRKYPAT